MSLECCIRLSPAHLPALCTISHTCRFDRFPDCPAHECDAVSGWLAIGAYECRLLSPSLSLSPSLPPVFPSVVSPVLMWHSRSRSFLRVCLFCRACADSLFHSRWLLPGLRVDLPRIALSLSFDTCLPCPSCLLCLSSLTCISRSSTDSVFSLSLARLSHS